MFSVTDPTGDDNGPGTYQYPTDSSLPARRVRPARLHRERDGEQGLPADPDRQPGRRRSDRTSAPSCSTSTSTTHPRAPTSTAAPFTSRNYTIAAADAWSEYLEAQGFASPIWQSAAGGSLGTPQFIVDGTAGTATLVMPRASFGDVVPGWTFTLALTGQDGFSSDGARAFTQPAGAFTFGVCPVGGTEPICSVDPSTVPKVMDTITPSGVSQSNELDPTLGAVELQGVTVGGS